MNIYNFGRCHEMPFKTIISSPVTTMKQLTQPLSLSVALLAAFQSMVHTFIRLPLIVLKKATRVDESMTLTISHYSYASSLQGGARTIIASITCFLCGQKGYTSIVCWKKDRQKSAPVSDNTKAKMPPEEKACYITSSEIAH